jgi:hypothetical protein
MNICNIEISNLVEWVIAIGLGIGGWYFASRSTLSQQRQERYNDLIQEFHQFMADFQLNFLPELFAQEDHQFIVQRINTHVKFIYWKAKDIDNLSVKNKIKIFDNVKRAGEEFIDNTLLSKEIETVLMNKDGDEITKNKFLLLAHKFVEDCYIVTKFV